MNIILKKNKRVLTKSYLLKVAKQANSNMYLEWQSVDEKTAIQIAENVAKKMGYKIA
jgi:hypothetical protein